MELKTIREILGKNETIGIHSKDKKILQRYHQFGGWERVDDGKGSWEYKEKVIDYSKDEKVVVAFRRNNLGCVFIIKGKKYFSFIHLYKSNTFNTFRIDNQEAIKFINDKTNESEVEPSHLQKIEAVEMINKLSEERLRSS